MDREEMKEQSVPSLPYYFSDNGHLLHTDSNDPYVYRFKRGDPEANQKEDQALCFFITHHVQRLMEENFTLHRFYLPTEPLTEGLSQGFVYLSSGALEHPDKLLVLIQDQGTVQCGLWNWRAVAHEGVEKGSQIPYVQRALEESYSVLLMNPNENGNNDREESASWHVHSVWDHLLTHCVDQRIVVVAHGYGGLAFVDLLCRRSQEVQQKVWAVAFLDSSHNMWHQPLRDEARDWLQSCSRRWVPSSKPLNQNVGSIKAGGLQVSAGTQSQRTVPAVCMESVFQFFSKKLQPIPPTAFSIVTRSRSLGQGISTPNA
ncbi:cotranscriptional regulator ARB2A homolog [Osmerus mordax]|uniref:cotranscriptional regulator ARB2A homolog n=1 Tax=Osmerus mordax TaxID=8014 RepID=UPI00350EA56E